jgi:cytochrome c-type biogenesis protein CcmF
VLTPARNYYPTMDPTIGPVGRYFEGEATSEIGLRSTAGSDFWAAFQPDLSVLDDDIAEGNRVFADIRNPDTPAAELETLALFRNEAVRRLAQSYADDPPPATFRVITNPLAVWLWIGALIALGGAAFAVWPSAEGRRRMRAAYAARLGRELKRA